MKTIMIVQNVSGEGPGMLEIFLKNKNIPFDLVDLDKGQDFPSPVDYGAVIVLGGPDSANDASPKIKTELERIKEILRLKIPYLGICLGLQTLVKAAGGQVVKNPVKELGFRDPENNIFCVELTPEGRKDPLLEGLSEKSLIFHLHGETVVLTHAMILLGKGKFCDNQIVKVQDRAYGIQGHFELTPEMFEDWIKVDPDLKALNRETLRRDFKKLEQEYAKVGFLLLGNFLKIAGY
jgi:GMP synthase (glutamine-hydrolysing)